MSGNKTLAQKKLHPMQSEWNLEAKKKTVKKLMLAGSLSLSVEVCCLLRMLTLEPAPFWDGLALFAGVSTVMCCGIAGAIERKMWGNESYRPS